MNKNHNILVVEDEKIIRDVITLKLESLGYGSNSVGCPEEAFHELAKNNYHVIISDIMMPEYSNAAVNENCGLIFAQQVFKLYPHIPVIFLTGRADDEIESEIHKASAAKDINFGAFFRKPFRNVEFKDAIENILGKINSSENDYIKELAFRDDIISCFTSLLKPIHKNNFLDAEELFLKVNEEIIYSTTAITQLFLLLPNTSQNNYRMLSQNGVEIIEAENINSEEQVNSFIKNKYKIEDSNTYSIEVSDKIKTTDGECIEVAYLTYVANTSRVNNQRSFSSFDDLVFSTLKQLIQFTEKNNKDRMTGLLRRDVAKSLFPRVLSNIRESVVQSEQDNRSEAKGSILTFIMTDIDKFKEINDTYGHEAGDICISTVGQLLNRNARRKNDKGGIGDIIARWGGEEFLIILPQCDSTSAQTIAENTRKEAEKTIIKYDDKEIKFTLSFGVYTVIIDDNRTKINLEELIKYADKLLYEAKTNGRNQVCAEQQKST